MIIQARLILSFFYIINPSLLLFIYIKVLTF
jgi:hypothetical protein